MLNEILQILRKREAPLFPSAPADAALSARIEAASDAELFGTVRDAKMAALCRAGTLLWNDDLAAAHAITQKFEGDPTADFWHAILHRREGDAANANYWWRRVGTHPAFEEVQTAALQVLEPFRETSGLAEGFAAALHAKGTWLPQLFTTYCADWPRDTPCEWPRRVQLAETETLLRWCLSRV